MIAAQNGDLEMAKLLLDAGDEINTVTPLGETPLFFAVNSGNPQLVEFLLENEAIPVVVDSFLTSPLMLAASKGDSQIVDILIPLVEDKNLKNKKGKMAYDIAEAKEYENIRLKLFPFLPDSLQKIIEKKEAEMDSMLVRGYDMPPQPQGGLATIQKQLEYPKKALEDKIEGTILFGVEIDETGKVGKTEILETFENRDCEKAAERAIKRVKWNPAKLKGQAVEGVVDIPVEFKIPEEPDPVEDVAQKPGQAQPDGLAQQPKQNKTAAQEQPPVQQPDGQSPTPKSQPDVKKLMPGQSQQETQKILPGAATPGNQGPLPNPNGGQPQKPGQSQQAPPENPSGQNPPAGQEQLPKPDQLENQQPAPEQNQMEKQQPAPEQIQPPGDPNKKPE